MQSLCTKREYAPYITRHMVPCQTGHRRTTRASLTPYRCPGIKRIQHQLNSVSQSPRRIADTVIVRGKEEEA